MKIRFFVLIKYEILYYFPLFCSQIFFFNFVLFTAVLCFITGFYLDLLLISSIGQTLENCHDSLLKILLYPTIGSLLKDFCIFDSGAANKSACFTNLNTETSFFIHFFQRSISVFMMLVQFDVQNGNM